MANTNPLDISDRLDAVVAADFTFTNHGTLWLVTPNTDAAFVHLEASTVGSDAQWLGRAVAVEPRFVAFLATLLQQDGFTTGQDGRS
jgi:hypothetical protein